MENIEELKREQYGLKARLHGVIELMNSEGFYSMELRERTLIRQQRVGMEIYLDSLTKRIYGKDELCGSTDTIWLPLLMSMFAAPWNPSPTASGLSEDDFKKEEDDLEDEIHAVPV